MNTTKSDTFLLNEPATIGVWIKGRTIFIELTDGRIVGYPADRFKIF